jgi:hypothetical protein
VSDGPQRLNTALLEQRLAVEPAPGGSDNAWELSRERLAQFGIAVADLTRLGPQAIQPREFVSAFVPATIANFGIVALSHPSGFWLNRWVNNAGVQVGLNAYADIGVILGLAGFSAAGVAISRSGFRADPNLLIVAGVTTAAQPFGYNLGATVREAFGPPIWVEPGRVLAFSCGTANTAITELVDVMAPTTRGIGV